MKAIKKLIPVLWLIFVLPTANAVAQAVKTIKAEGLNLTYYNSVESNFGATSVLILGKEDAILVDALFTVTDAEKVAAEIKKSRKNLKAIFVSYGDPDYYFGLEVFRKHYPKVPIYATATTIKHIKTSYREKLAYWGKIYKTEMPKKVIIPEQLSGNLLLEGKKLEVISVKNAPERTFVWIPSIKAVVGGINVYGNDFHVWTADDATVAKRMLWVQALDKIKSLNPKIVIPAHFGNKADLTEASVDHTKNYLLVYNELLKTKKTSKALITSLKNRYPHLRSESGLEMGAQVNTGEIKWK